MSSRIPNTGCYAFFLSNALFGPSPTFHTTSFPSSFPGPIFQVMTLHVPIGLYPRQYACPLGLYSRPCLSWRLNLHSRSWPVFPLSGIEWAAVPLYSEFWMMVPGLLSLWMLKFTVLYDVHCTVLMSKKRKRRKKLDLSPCIYSKSSMFSLYIRATVNTAQNYRCHFCNLLPVNNNIDFLTAAAALQYTALLHTLF